MNGEVLTTSNTNVNVSQSRKTDKTKDCTKVEKSEVDIIGNTVNSTNDGKCENL